MVALRPNKRKKELKMGKCEKTKSKPVVEVSEEIIEKVKLESKDGALSCRQALMLANILGVTPAKIGAACDRSGIRVKGCQLGCF